MLKLLAGTLVFIQSIFVVLYCLEKMSFNNLIKQLNINIQKEIDGAIIYKNIEESMIITGKGSIKIVQLNENVITVYVCDKFNL